MVKEEQKKAQESEMALDRELSNREDISMQNSEEPNILEISQLYKNSELGKVTPELYPNQNDDDEEDDDDDEEQAKKDETNKKDSKEESQEENNFDEYNFQQMAGYSEPPYYNESQTDQDF